MVTVSKAVIRNLLLIAVTLGSTLTCATEVSVKTMLSGSQELPPITTIASGSGSIVVNADRTITRSTSTTAIKGTAVHIHEAVVGVNGPMIVLLMKTSEHVGLFRQRQNYPMLNTTVYCNNDRSAWLSASTSTPDRHCRRSWSEVPSAASVKGCPTPAHRVPLSMHTSAPQGRRRTTLNQCGSSSC
jgi:CHRD domain